MSENRGDLLDVMIYLRNKDIPGVVLDILGEQFMDCDAEWYEVVESLLTEMRRVIGRAVTQHHDGRNRYSTGVPIRVVNEVSESYCPRPDELEYRPR